MNSLCTARTVRDYFRGILPANGTVCQVDGETFPDPEMAVNAIDLDEEDQQLLRAWEAMGEAIFAAKGW